MNLGPDDVENQRGNIALIENRLSGAPDEFDLLLDVGNFNGIGDDPVFDLDGNVAEWALSENGECRALGPSAIRLAEGALPGDQTPLHYCGFRIVLE